VAYIPDLASYDYYPGALDALAVGWLDASEPFSRGDCPTDVRDRLDGLSRQPVRLMRGYHYCQFCERTARSHTVMRAELRSDDGPEVARGNGEIWLTAPGGTNYAAPVMVVHYIDEHMYLPPGAFIDAVRMGDPPDGVS
jgi:hypothetical protein